MLRRTYNFLFPLVFLALAPAYLRRMFRRGNYRAQFAQRFGWYTPQLRERMATGESRWWIQAVSVGEMLIALKLIAALRKKDPQAQFILSTTTTTGMQLARERAGIGVETIYTPIDAKSCVRRAFAALRPSRIIIVEGGLWPNLLWETKDRGISTALVSARLSDRSEKRYRRFPKVSRAIFELLDLVCVPEPEDVSRWKSLGVPEEHLVCTGNIKFDEEALPMSAVTCPPKTLLAASTHPGEEMILARTFLALKRDFPDLFLIIAPRHVERTPEIERALSELKVRLCRRSAFSEGAERPDILLLDTTGELRQWVAAAAVVFVGKSLTAVGGQNPAEAALAGRPVIFGPHMENFRAVTTELLKAGAAIQIENESELAPQIARLLADPALGNAMGRAGLEALAAHRGAAERTARALGERGGISPCQ